MSLKKNKIQGSMRRRRGRRTTTRMGRRWRRRCWRRTRIPSEGEEEKEESDVVRELLSKHSGWLGMSKKKI